MPRLNHKKTRDGCRRCKARKVKCDEGKPRCSACARHNVPCEYLPPAPRARSDAPAPSRPAMDPAMSSLPSVDFDKLNNLYPQLELRLMHQWTAHTSQSFSLSVDFWRYEAPLLAMNHRVLLDAMFGLAALQSSRQDPTTYRRTANGDTTRDSHQDPTTNARLGYESNMDPVNRDTLLDARMYWHRAMSEHQTALSAQFKENSDAAYLGSVLMTLHALFVLSEMQHDPALQTQDVATWLRLSEETNYLNDLRMQAAGGEALDLAGIQFGRSALTEGDQLFQQDQGQPFASLLTFAEDYEAMTPTDRSAYQQAVAYISLVYNGINDASMHPLEACYRLAAMPSRLPKRFTEQIEMRTPRAMVILAHAFALMRLVSEDVLWLRGIAEVQVPSIQQQIPAAWNEMMKWPISIAQGALTRENHQSTGSDVLVV
ncbi:unnamed protein product [Zymoseptoria tritici ST99CH_1E4]|uniref:Zn(2)-C6 fungal-type domain-containing protein n=1 Tax=Zymoseptoria tritici ST99CH_1E4 TaxID=1276532 RepID=A0A2H1GKS3_ZYMTR|nr:unnamed protein product [Zymoseptoria tritici ST99CH_1E4]